jgi:hypothetical protein
VANPAAVRAEASWDAGYLSQGTVGSIKNNKGKLGSVPEGTRYQLPVYCADNLGFATDGAALTSVDFADLRPMLVDRRQWEPVKPLQLSCSETLELGRVVSITGPKEARTLMSHDGYTFSTTASNITALEQHSHVIGNVSLLTSAVAGSVATVCGVGLAVTERDSRPESPFSSCALVALSVALVGVGLAIVDPTIVSKFDLTAPAP